jgi:hypothetical protein
MTVMWRNKVAAGWIWAKDSFLDRRAELKNCQQKGLLGILVKDRPDKGGREGLRATTGWHLGLVLNGLVYQVSHAVDAVHMATVELMQRA